MLTDAALKNLKSKDKPYKVTDRDGMYVRVGTNGTIGEALHSANLRVWPSFSAKNDSTYSRSAPACRQRA